MTRFSSHNGDEVRYFDVFVVIWLCVMLKLTFELHEVPAVFEPI